MASHESRPMGLQILFGGGEAPDPRFTLANERTFLAWIRTALALLGGGVAIEAFGAQAFEPRLRIAMAMSLVVLSLLLSAGACLRWLQVERALRQRRPLPLPALVPVLAMGSAFAAVLAGSMFWWCWGG